MDLVRRLTSEAPNFESFRDSKPTLLVSWWCTAYAISIIIVRFCGRYVRAEKIFLEDGIMVGAMVPLLIRMAFVHVVLIYGTNNTKTEGLSSENIKHRELGSQLVLISRIFYVAYLWAIKYSTSMFLRTLTESVSQRSHQRMLRYLHYFLAATFIATVIADLAACQPFPHYWQVVPDPGPQCRSGYAHLLTTGILNIITNIALIVFPIPMILKSRLPQAQKITILLRLSLPTLSIILTLYTLPRVVQKHGSQPFRSLLASFDILLATFTSNALVLVSLLQDKGYKKSKYKTPAKGYETRVGASQAGGTANGNGAFNGGRRPSAWGSDDDLISSVDEEREAGKSGGSVVAMEVLPRKSDVGGKLGTGRSGRSRSRGRGLIEEPPRAKLQEIRVAQTWEIVVEDENGTRRD